MKKKVVCFMACGENASTYTNCIRPIGYRLITSILLSYLPAHRSNSIIFVYKSWPILLALVLWTIVLLTNMIGSGAVGVKSANVWNFKPLSLELLAPLSVLSKKIIIKLSGRNDQLNKLLIKSQMSAQYSLFDNTAFVKWLAIT